MRLLDRAKVFLNQRELREILLPLLNQVARLQHKGVKKIFFDDGVWMHETRFGYFAYHQPFISLDMARLDELAETNFLWGYRPRPGDTVIDVGAGVGEEALTFSRALGPRGKLISIEAHPRTFRCLEKLIEYNRLSNVVPIHTAVSETPGGTVYIENSDAYLANRLQKSGIPVPATTIDCIYRKLGLRRIHFLKMNIEGAERFAIRAMRETLCQTEIFCISCHDALAEITGDDALRTRLEVRQFLIENGIRVCERRDPDLPSYIRDQVWGFNDRLLQMKAVAG